MHGSVNDEACFLEFYWLFYSPKKTINNIIHDELSIIEISPLKVPEILVIIIVESSIPQYISSFVQSTN